MNVSVIWNKWSDMTCTVLVVLNIWIELIIACVPYCYQHFKFKSWYGPAIQVQTLNGLMETISLGYKW